MTWKNAFPRTKRDILWNIVYDMGVKGKFWRVLMKLYKKTTIQIRLGKLISKKVLITQGLRQGCPLSSTLFTMYIDNLVKHLKDTNTGITVGSNRR